MFVRPHRPLMVAVFVLFFLTSGLIVTSQSAPQDDARERAKAKQLLAQGNWKEALEIFQLLAKNPNTDALIVHEDLAAAVDCSQRLRNPIDFDTFLNEVVAAHSTNPRVLHQAARALIFTAYHYGIVANNRFQRGPYNDSTGTNVWVDELDRRQGLRWMEAALPKVQAMDTAFRIAFYRDFENMIRRSRDATYAWKLQDKTDLDEAPDYLVIDQENWNSTTRFAPVDKEKQPVLYAVPSTWQEAKSDGERMRWIIQQWAEISPVEAKLNWAGFLDGQFGVSTLASNRWIWGVQPVSSDNDESAKKTGVFAMHTLADEETIAQLASGVQRFRLADEYNPIAIWKELIAAKPDDVQAYRQLFNEYTNRRQYAKAATIARDALQRFPNDDAFQKGLGSIVDARGRFEQIATQLAGSPASVSFVFRNAKSAQFTAQRVELERLYTDIKAFYRDFNPARPARFKGQNNRMPPSLPIPAELFTNVKIEEYLAGEVGQWKLDLTPLDNHWDRRISIATPLQEPGLYVVTAKLDDSNFIARCLVCVQDTAIVRKQLDKQILYQVLDAKSGIPIANTTIEFFGVREQYSDEGKRLANITSNFAKKTNNDGQVIVTEEEQGTDRQWIVTARTRPKSFATLGMEYLWFNPFFAQSFQQLKAYGVSDRPAYKPGDTIHAKLWVAQANYGDDAPGVGPTANQAGKQYAVKLIDSQGASLWNGTIETDRYGGAPIDVSIPKEAKLGRYQFLVQDGSIQCDLAVRVEEYRKPEFEVTVKAPEKPMMLGEVLKATVQAKYYFGTPVVGAKAYIKVTRTAFDDQYFPVRPFDWCFSPGYWWTAYDAPWYPRWESWVGCRRPFPWWLPFHNDEPPELVFEQEVLLDENGEAHVEVDTSLAKQFQSTKDHKYHFAVDVRDASRRTISASGEVIAARQAFKIYGWNDRGYGTVNDKIVAHFQARTLGGDPVEAKGKLDLLRIQYNEKREPVESIVDSWDVATNSEGILAHSFVGGRSGQYRMRLTLTDKEEHTIEGGYLFTIRGGATNGNDFRFSALELIPDKLEYKPGERVKLQINADRDDAMVAVFIRPENGVYKKPIWSRLTAKSAIVEIPVEDRDQPNFFVEAITVYDGKFHQEVREIFVPPQERVLDVEVSASKSEYLPGEEAEVTIVVKDKSGLPVDASSVLAVYDRSLDQIAPDVLPPDIREFFWKWRRAHYPQSVENLSRRTGQVYIRDMPSPEPLGRFGRTMADDAEIVTDALSSRDDRQGANRRFMRAESRMDAMPMSAAAPMDEMAAGGAMGGLAKAAARGAPGEIAGAEPPAIRKDFADAAYWRADLRTGTEGKQVVKFKMPENLTSWQIAVWSMGDRVQVGSAKIQALTRKNLMVRLQTPRFLVDRDEVVLSALVNNDFDEAVTVDVSLDGFGESLVAVDSSTLTQTIEVESHGQKRVDWRCRAVKTGEPKLTVTARSTRESDAMQLTLPVIVNGILRTESFAGIIRKDRASSEIRWRVPEARIADQSKLIVRVSPSLAMSMVDALPFLVDYPHGCTEQTLNRFVPTVIVHRTLQRMGVNLESIKESRTNLNAQQLGPRDDPRAQRKYFDRNPVFDNAEVAKMVEVGLRRLTEMQNADGGWGWFSGNYESSWPHTTAVVVRGLLVAQEADAAIVPDCLQRGLVWLENHRQVELQKLLSPPSDPNHRSQPYDLDAFVHYVLVTAGRPSTEMQDLLYEKRDNLSVHSKALLALATHTVGSHDKSAMLRRNIEQFLVEDLENETAYLRNEASWWVWYGGSIEATALYLKLLAKVDPQGPTAPRLVKYLLNNRKHATYWNSTRDTAQVIESFADYLAATNEANSTVAFEAWLDGQSIGEISFTPENLFSVNNTIRVEADAITAGEHRLELKRTGDGPLYWNVYQTDFTLEDEIKPAGLELKVDRRYYRVEPITKELVMAGDRGEIGKGKKALFERTPIDDLSTLKSGQIVEVELLLESKNDYEYVMLHDPKAAAFEPTEVSSGYSYSGSLAVYREFRERSVDLFLRQVPRGTHSIRYQVRCEAPGKFTALPATATGMYAPELIGNSADFDAIVLDE